MGYDDIIENSQEINALRNELEKLKSDFILVQGSDPWAVEDDDTRRAISIENFNLHASFDWSLGFIMNICLSLVQRNAELEAKLQHEGDLEDDLK